MTTVLVSWISISAERPAAVVIFGAASSVTPPLDSSTFSKAPHWASETTAAWPSTTALNAKCLGVGRTGGRITVGRAFDANRVGLHGSLAEEPVEADIGGARAITDFEHLDFERHDIGWRRRGGRAREGWVGRRRGRA